MARRQIPSLSERESLLSLPYDELTLTRMALIEHEIALISTHLIPASRFDFAALLCNLQKYRLCPDKKITPSDALLKNIASMRGFLACLPLL